MTLTMKVALGSLVAAGAVLWGLAIYGFTPLGLLGGAAWVAADRLRRRPR